MLDCSCHNAFLLRFFCLATQGVLHVWSSKYLPPFAILFLQLLVLVVTATIWQNKAKCQSSTRCSEKLSTQRGHEGEGLLYKQCALDWQLGCGEFWYIACNYSIAVIRGGGVSHFSISKYCSLLPYQSYLHWCINVASYLVTARLGSYNMTWVWFCLDCCRQLQVFQLQVFQHYFRTEALPFYQYFHIFSSCFNVIKRTYANMCLSFKLQGPGCSWDLTKSLPFIVCSIAEYVNES